MVERARASARALAAIAVLVGLPLSPQLSGAQTHNQTSPGRCRLGFVWREAGPGDRVCVEAWAHARVLQENADNRLHSISRPLGAPPKCVAGYVFRQAFVRDLVCVTPTSHAQAEDENALGPSRRAPG